MKMKICIALLSCTAFLQASYGHLKIATCNPLQDYTKLSHTQVRVALSNVEAEWKSSFAKALQEVERQQMLARIQELTTATMFVTVLTESDCALQGLVNKQQLKAVQGNLLQVLTESAEDKVIRHQLELMEKALKVKYLFKQPSARKVEAQRIALKELVFARLIAFVNLKKETMSIASSTDSNSSEEYDITSLVTNVPQAELLVAYEHYKY